jgi:hypothetical protein
MILSIQMSWAWLFPWFHLRKITTNIVEECNLAHTKFLQTNHAQFMPAGCRPAATVIQLAENSQWWQKMVCMMETQTHVSNSPLVSPPDCRVSKVTPWLCLTLILGWTMHRKKVDLQYPLILSQHFPLFIVFLCSSLVGGIKSMQMVLLYSVVKYTQSYLWHACIDFPI